jgi:hypothetical protein
MKKGIIIIIVILAGLFIVRGLSPEDAWLCVDGQWIEHGHPAWEHPKTGCGGMENN